MRPPPALRHEVLDAFRSGSLSGMRTRPSDRDSPVASSAVTASPRCSASDEREDHNRSAMTESNDPYAALLLSEKSESGRTAREKAWRPSPR